MKPSFFVVAITVVSISCDDPGPHVTDGLAAVTDRADYLLGETIRLEFRNNGSGPLQLASCCSDVAFYVDSWTNTTWEQVEVRGLPCPMLCLSVALVIPPAARRLDSLWISHEGTFRLRIPFDGPGHAEFRREVVTNSFVVRTR